MKKLGLTKRQKDFLDKYTDGTWTYNPATGLVDVKGYFDYSSKGAKTLRGVKFGKVSGHFDCGNNQLTSLAGAPQEVGGGFDCSNNILTSLKGAPQKVGGYFSCSNNKLTSLKGAPKKVGRDFYCGGNSLTSLKGAPQKVGGWFDCSSNKLTSLAGAPQKVIRFYCRNNKLTSLEGGPKKVVRDFDCRENELTSLKGGPQEVGRNFDCRENELTSLKGGPQEVGRDFWCDAFRSYKWEKGWNPESWLSGVKRRGLKTRKLLVTLLPVIPVDTLNKEIAKDPTRMIMNLKEVWNDEDFKEIRSKLVWPKGYDLEADLVGDLYGVGF